MNFSLEKIVSNFIKTQLPSFYDDEGPNFISFLEAYYEWMEQEGNPIYEMRQLLNYRDIDNTLDSFLDHFQTKYLYGIPLTVSADKRLLLKHVLDVYRSKGSIRCFKLLFRLLYNENIEIYLPGQDMLRVSDGSWQRPRYIEVTDNGDLQSFVGQPIVGISSGVTAIVESYISEPVNQNIVHILFLSNILPLDGSFSQGEKVINKADKTSNPTNSPTVLGSLDSLNILRGGTGFRVGSIMSAVHFDSNNNIISFGRDGKLTVTATSNIAGILNFSIDAAGFGYSANATTWVYRGVGDTTGSQASFSISHLSNTRNVTYNTDLLSLYRNVALNATQFGLDASPTANLSSVIGPCLSYQNNVFGSIGTILTSQGLSYTNTPFCFIHSLILSDTVPTGTVTYDTSSSVITGTGTSFTSLFQNNRVIALQANVSLPTTFELQVIKTVSNDTSITLYGQPTFSSTPSSFYKTTSDVMTSNFAFYESIMFQPDNTIPGINGKISAFPSLGIGSVKSCRASDSGEAYQEGEIITAYLYNSIQPLSVVNGGINYKNNEILIFSDSDTNDTASGYVQTDGNGMIIDTVLSYPGSNYLGAPKIYVQTANGSGANIIATVAEFDVDAVVLGTVHKTGVGVKPGYWLTTDGFLNADKYIQDSFFYQDFSYQIKSSLQLNTYKGIIYDTFHPAGSELFGQFLLIDDIQNPTQNILYEQSTATIS